MFIDPVSLVSQFGILPGMHIADIGTGSGTYALAAATLVGPKGKVYACDVQRGLVDRLRKEAEARNMTNFSCIWADAERKGGTKLADAVLDATIVANVLFQAEDKEAFLRELSRVVKPEGRVFFIDWADTEDPLGPKTASLVLPEAVLALFGKYGFTKERELDAGSHHYGFVFIKKK
jgi:ubiquinone/menaquinone biosynthesis C-methylase UbiE